MGWHRRRGDDGRGERRQRSCLAQPGRRREFRREPEDRAGHWRAEWWCPQRLGLPPESAARLESRSSSTADGPMRREKIDRRPAEAATSPRRSSRGGLSRCDKLNGGKLLYGVACEIGRRASSVHPCEKGESAEGRERGRERDGPCESSSGGLSMSGVCAVVTDCARQRRVLPPSRRRLGHVFLPKEAEQLANDACDLRKALPSRSVLDWDAEKRGKNMAAALQRSGAGVE